MEIVCKRTFRIRIKTALQFLGPLLLLLLINFPVLSQANLGRILGTVTDETGAVVAGVTVTVTDVQRGVSRTLITDQTGAYLAPGLLPGAYSVRAEAKGFQTIERSGLLLEVGKDIQVNFSLQPGQQSQTVTVTAEAPMVETTNATLGGTISNQAIVSLPLNGRNYINLLTLRPGVTVYPGGGVGTRSANGSRPEDIGYLVDGLRADEAYTGESVLNSAIPAGDSTTALPIDAIQEFNTEQNPKAEFGWKPGTVVNAGLKSGTNNIHGTAFAFGRDTALDARNYFDNPPAEKNPIALEQFGGSIGGPIKKDKLFYFADYEGQRYSVGSTFILTPPVTVPIPSGGGKGCNGPLLTAGIGNCGQSMIDACNDVGAANISPLSAHIAGLNPANCTLLPTNFTPGPNENLFPANPNPAGGVILGLGSNNQQDNGVAKIDYHINANNSLSGMYFNGHGGGIWNDISSQVGRPFLSNLQGRTQLGSGTWTWTPTSNLVNEFRVGYSHFAQSFRSVDADVNPLAYGINTGVTDPRFFGFPLLRINPFSLNTFRLGGNWPKLTGPDGSLQISEQVSLLHGNHAFKFGGEINHNTAQPFITANGKGSIRFKNLEQFLEGKVKNSAPLSAILLGNPERHLHDYQIAAFAQDDWRINSRLTVNLGLRYELTTVVSDSQGLLGNFLPSVGLVQVGHGESSAFNGDHNNFSPRLGLAWDVRGDGKTVIRAGGNVMYSQLPFNVFIAVANQLGLNQVPTGATIVTQAGTQPGIGTINVQTLQVPGPTLTPRWQAQTGACATGSTACGALFPTAPECGDGINGDPFPCNTAAVDPNLRSPYVTTWTLNVERAITNNLSLEVAYVGTHGAKLPGFININQPATGAAYPTFTSPINGFTSEIAYCNNVPVNQATPANGIACDPGDADPKLAQANRPFTLNNKFTYLGQIDPLGNYDTSNYNGLQVTVTQRTSHGLSFVAGYTYSHALDNASSTFNANPLPVSSTVNPAGLMYGNSDFDRPHVFSLSVTYAIPGIKSPAQLLQGWEVNSIVSLQSGATWTPTDAAEDFTGTDQIDELNSFGQFWNFSGNHADFTSGPTNIPCWSGSGPSALGGCLVGGSAPPAVCMNAAKTTGEMNTLLDIGCYFKGNSALTPPAIGSIGNSGRNFLRDSGFRNWDFSVTKNFSFKERLTAQFRAEFFNILNHPEFTNPNGPAGVGLNDPSAGFGFGCGCGTPDQEAPNPVLGSGGNRSVQLGLKLIF